MDYYYVMILIFFLVSFSAWSQITDASFFPSMKSINPGVVHMRRGGLIAIDYGKKSSEKEHDVQTGGLVEPIKTNIDLTKTSLFGAAASRFVSAEVLLDKETGERVQKINHPTRGNRKVKDDAESTFAGAMLDFRFFGVSYSTANYNYLNEFRVGNPPDLTARDEDKDITYTNLKIGTAIKISALRMGVYFLNQKGDGDFTYTFYDPTSGNKGSSEKFPMKQSAKGYGLGVGLTLPKFRTELSLEKLYDNDLDISYDYPGQINKAKDSSRISGVAEANLRYFLIGVRVRSIKGNYIDLEDIISTNLLYDTLGADDTRLETTFNFSFGDSKGLSPSLFYSQSEVKSKELSPVFDNGLKYKAVTKSKAFGANLSYRF